jgi:hypothetical protein
VKYSIVTKDYDGFLLCYGTYDTYQDADDALCNYGPVGGYIVTIDNFGDIVDS